MIAVAGVAGGFVVSCMMCYDCGYSSVEEAKYP